MKTSELIRTVRRIRSLFSEELETLISGGLGRGDMPADLTVKIIYSFGEVASAVSRDARAAEVLSAFGLDILVSKPAAIEALQAVLVGRSDASEARGGDSTLRW